MTKNGRVIFAATVFLATIAHSPSVAQLPQAWPREQGWGYVPLLGLGFNWRRDQAPQAPQVVTSAEEIAYCARRFRSYDPVSQTFIGPDGVRYPCPWW